MYGKSQYSSERLLDGKGTSMLLKYGLKYVLLNNKAQGNMYLTSKL